MFRPEGRRWSPAAPLAPRPAAATSGSPPSTGIEITEASTPSSSPAAASVRASTSSRSIEPPSSPSSAGAPVLGLGALERSREVSHHRRHPCVELRRDLPSLASSRAGATCVRAAKTVTAKYRREERRSAGDDDRVSWRWGFRRRVGCRGLTVCGVSSHSYGLQRVKRSVGGRPDRLCRARAMFATLRCPVGRGELHALPTVAV